MGQKELTGEEDSDGDSTSGSFVVEEEEGISVTSFISPREECEARVEGRISIETREEDDDEEDSGTRSKTTESPPSSNKEDSLGFFRKQDISRTEIECQMQAIIQQETEQQEREVTKGDEVQVEPSPHIQQIQQEFSVTEETAGASSSDPGLLLPSGDRGEKSQERITHEEGYEQMMMEEEGEEEEPGAPDIESSQATERDFAKSEFSLEQQDSQDIDEESLSGLASHATLASAVQIPQGLKSSGPSSLPPVLSLSSSSGLRFMRKQTSLDEQTSFPRIPETAASGLMTKPVVPSKAHLMQEIESQRMLSSQRRKNLLRSQSQDVQSASSVTPFTTTSASGITSASSTDVQSFPYQPLPSYTSSVSTMTSFLTESSKIPLSPVISSVQAVSSISSPATTFAASETETSVETTAQSPPIKTPQVQSVTIDIIYKSTVPSRVALEEEDSGLYTEAYDSQSWLYINKRAEYDVWIQRLNAPPDQSDENEDLTEAEKIFKKQFASLTHRMIHRKASLEMFRRLFANTFRVDKTVTVKKNNGEFGFRIHGSRPVVVSAIEKSTAAEASGLEVGDVIMTLNDKNVLEASHSDVVKLAHSGPQILKIDLLRTISCLGSATSQESLPFGITSLMSGFLMYKTPTKMSAWKKRWFSFHSDNILYWYKKVDDADPLGVLKLKGCRVHLEDQPDPGIITRIITIRHRASNTILLSLQTASTELAVQWIQGLTKTIIDPNIDPFLVLSSIQWSKLPPTAILDSDCSGYLGKFSHVNKIWRQRYFVLKDACLLMYENVSSSTPLGIIYLHGYRAQSCSMVGKKNTFEIVASQPKFKHFWFMAESEVVKKR